MPPGIKVFGLSHPPKRRSKTPPDTKVFNGETYYHSMTGDSFNKKEALKVAKKARDLGCKARVVNFREWWIVYAKCPKISSKRGSW